MPSLFQPKSPLEPAFNYALETGQDERQLDVFRWEDRLVAHEEASGLWWGALDVCGDRDDKEFWGECVANERVGRLFSHRQGFQKAGANGAMLLMGEGPYHVLVAQDNSGLVRVDNGTKWYPFSAIEPWGIHKLLAKRPTIWSRLFLTKFALRALPALEPMAVELLPEAMHAVWLEGDNVLPLRLIKAALVLGWADSLNGKELRFWLKPASFWREVLERRSSLVLHQEKGEFSLPEGMLQSPETTLPGDIIWSGTTYLGQYNQTPVFRWKSPEMEVHVRLRLKVLSAQKQADLRLELYDWLCQFFPLAEVESWFNIELPPATIDGALDRC